MKVSYKRLFNKLKSEGLTQKDFKDSCGISGGTMGNLINNKGTNTSTICKICDFFQCMPDEIMEWIPEGNYDQKRKEKQEINDQIAALQEKLKKL